MHTDLRAQVNEYSPIYFGTETLPMEKDRWSYGSKPLNTWIPIVAALCTLFISWTKKIRRRDNLIYPPNIRARMSTIQIY